MNFNLTLNLLFWVSKLYVKSFYYTMKWFWSQSVEFTVALGLNAFFTGGMFKLKQGICFSLTLIGPQKTVKTAALDICQVCRIIAGLCIRFSNCSVRQQQPASDMQSVTDHSYLTEGSGLGERVVVAPVWTAPRPEQHFSASSTGSTLL